MERHSAKTHTSDTVPYGAYTPMKFLISLQNLTVHDGHTTIIPLPSSLSLAKRFADVSSQYHWQQRNMNKHNFWKPLNQSMKGKRWETQNMINNTKLL